MNENSSKSSMVVTVLRSQLPIALVEISPVGPDAEQVDVWHNEVPDLEAAYGALASAAHSLGFVLWRMTGKLPPPRDYGPPDEQYVIPF